MKIKIFLDTICGWCYIGHKRLFETIAEFKNKKFEVEYAPFLLNPQYAVSRYEKDQII